MIKMGIDDGQWAYLSGQILEVNWLLHLHEKILQLY